MSTELEFYTEGTVLLWSNRFGNVMNWDENSPLPPGVRYFELGDLEYPIYLYYRGRRDLSTFFTNITSTDQLLPRDSHGVIRRNVKSLPDNAWHDLPSIYEDDSYWTGEVVDPLSWADTDLFWQLRGFNRETISSFLADHPAAKLT